MIVNRNFVARCSGCHKVLKIYEYQGLEGGLYGEPCLCAGADHIRCHDDDEASLFYGLKEVSRAPMPNLA